MQFGCVVMVVQLCSYHLCQCCSTEAKNGKLQRSENKHNLKAVPMIFRLIWDLSHEVMNARCW